MNTPQHPGRQQQGLEAPQSQGNPYYTPNTALQAAQAQQAQAAAGKAQAETAIMQQAQGGLGSPVQAGPTVSPQEVQAQQIADGIIKGQLGQEQLGAMIQAGEVDQRVAEAAMGMAQQFLQQDQARNAQAMGLGGL